MTPETIYPNSDHDPLGGPVQQRSSSVVTENKTMQNQTTAGSTSPNPRKRNTAVRLASLLLGFGAAALLAGCSGGLSHGAFSSDPVPATVTFSGNVHGGQQPVVGATIQLYTVGTTGLRSASTALIPTTVTTGAGGGFSITGTYSCTNATQVYIVATQGNPGAGNNTALSLGAALGSCATLQAAAATTFIQINELSTVAMAYALAPFAQDYTHIGASGANPVGLVNAISSANSIVNLASGTAPGASSPAGTVVPGTELNTLANILASCVNSQGPQSSGCTTLFGATGATETLGAALAIAKNPGASAVTALYTLSTANAPFQPAYTTQPNDFTLAVSYNAGGAFATPYGIAVDQGGNAWVTNETGTAVQELSPIGAPVAALSTTNLVGAQGVAIDRTGNVWVANTAGNSVIKFSLTLGVVSANNTYTAGGVAAPSAIALDSAGNAFVTNFNGNSVTGLTNAGAALAGSPFAGSNGNLTLPTAVALDGSGSVYAATGAGTVVKLTNAGAYAATLTDNALQGALGVAIDTGTGNVFATGDTTGTAIAGGVSEFVSGAANAVSPVSSGSVPLGVATDGTSIWVANAASGGSLMQLQNGSAAAASPAAGFGSLNTPIGVAVDASGNVWTTNSGSNTVSKFIGLAVPVATPIAANVGP